MSRITPPRSHRAAALLIVLVALILTVTATAGIARVAATAKLQRQTADRQMIADELLNAAEAPILYWLKTESSKVVLSADATTPAIGVLNDRIFAGDSKDRLGLRICAFDQCGMAPVRLFRAGSPIRLELPASLLNAVDRIELKGGDIAGLDIWSEQDNASEVPVFPACVLSEPLTFGPSQAEAIERERSMSATSLPALGESVATHNPGQLNVNTTPIELLDAAMRVSGRDGVDQIVAARSLGKPAPAPQAGSSTRQHDQKDAPGLEFTSSSTVWSFRIDIEVGPSHRSWWAVYQKSPRDWECVQRLAITE